MNDCVAIMVWILRQEEMAIGSSERRREAGGSKIRGCRAQSKTGSRAGRNMMKAEVSGTTFGTHV